MIYGTLPASTHFSLAAGVCSGDYSAPRSQWRGLPINDRGRRVRSQIATHGRFSLKEFVFDHRLSRKILRS